MPERAGDDQVEPGQDEQRFEHDGENAARRGEQHDAGDRGGSADQNASRSPGVMLTCSRAIAVSLVPSERASGPPQGLSGGRWGEAPGEADERSRGRRRGVCAAYRSHASPKRSATSRSSRIASRR